MVRCPLCNGHRAKIVWRSNDGKAIGIKCEHSTAEHKKGVVIIVEVGLEG